MRLLTGLWAVAAIGLFLCAGAAGKSRVSAVKAAAVTAGGGHACSVTSGGGLECWGSNEAGQLGDGTTLDRHAPVAVVGLSGSVRAVSAGGSELAGHTCALTRAGGVECWGSNEAGQVGDGTRTARRAPVGVMGLTRGVQAIATGGQSFSGGFSCALTTRGAVRCWGANDTGQLGDGTRHFRTRPVAVHGLGPGRKVKAIAAGGGHGCAVTRARRVLCWGNNEYGQLGDGTTRTRTTPVPVRGIGQGVLAIALQGQSTCVLTSGRRVMCWGYNSEGELGDGTTTDRTRPVAVSGLRRVSMLAAGDVHACAGTSGGALKCWGFNSYGQLGDGTRREQHHPVTVSGLAKGVSGAAAGDDQTCALVRRGALKCWGYNKHGQVGDGSTTTRLSPAAVIGFGSAPCVVPDARRLRLAAARHAVTAGRCRTGLIERVASSAVQKGLVISQSPPPGTRLNRGGEVHLVVSGTPPGINFSTPPGWVVSGLSADGHRVAVHVVHRSCHRILIWRGAGTPVAVNAGCTEENDRSVTDFALAGQRVAWADYEYGNHAYCYLLTATVAKPRARDTDFCQGESGTFIGHFAGDGPLLVFNAWGEGAALYRLAGTSARRILAGPGKATSVGGGRIAVRERGAVSVYRSSGARVRRFPIAARTAKLDGSTLVVQRGTSMRPYGLSGRAKRARRLQGEHPRLADVANGIAAYVAGPTVHLLRLSDGKDVPLRVTRAARATAEIEPAGLFYASRTRVTFIPMSAVRRLFR